MKNVARDRLAVLHIGLSGTHLCSDAAGSCAIWLHAKKLLLVDLECQERLKWDV